MAYETSDVLESETAYKVLKLINQKEGGSYPSEIGEEIDAHQSTISDILKTLREMELVKRGRRTKAQYYKLNIEELISFTRNYWNFKKEEVLEGEHHFSSENDPEFVQINDFEEKFSDWDKKIPEQFLEDYFTGYFQNVSVSTIRKMIFSNLQINLVYLINYLDTNSDTQKLENKVRAMQEIHDRVEYDPDVLIVSALKEKYLE